ncbi:MAG: GTP-binding protein [Candidatus Thorarchaeota archaeon]|nr:GTP-binding protein [Candidatus Thorarchaeota archaeon]
MTEHVAYLWKLVFLGEGGVGKTSLVGRYVYDSFEGDYLATIGAAMHTKPVKVDDTLCKLVIWDIAGQDDFAQLRKAYYQNASGAFFVFDTTRPATLQRIDEWIEALNAVTGKIPIVLLENKVDLESRIERAELEKIAKKFDMKLIQTSAKEDTNVEEAFLEMTREILEKSRLRKRIVEP